MKRRELIGHLMVEHHLDVGKLPNPTDDELISLHKSQPHHVHGMSNEEVFELYRTQNPSFEPPTGETP